MKATVIEQFHSPTSGELLPLRSEIESPEVERVLENPETARRIVVTDRTGFVKPPQASAPVAASAVVAPAPAPAPPKES